MEKPSTPEADIPQPVGAVKPEVGDDQGDSGPDRENPITERSNHPAPVEPEDAHIGATEAQVSDTTAPAGEEYKDEPRQG